MSNTFARRSRRTGFIIVASLICCTCAAMAGNWPQWRGPDHSGIGPGAVPLKWTDKQNVEWVRPISGRGNSSPVIWDNHVYLTTVYETDWWRSTHQKVAGTEAVLAVIVVAGAIALALRIARLHALRRENAGVFGGALLLLAAAVGLASAVVFGESFMDYPRSNIRAWLGASFAVSCALLIAARRLPPGSRLRTILSLLCICFGVFVIAGIPDKPKSFRHGPLAPNSYIVVTAGLLPILTGIYLLLRRRALFTAPVPPAREGLARTSRRRGAALNLMLLVAVTAAVAIAVALALSIGRRASDYLNYHISNVRFVPAIGWNGVWVAAAALALLIPLIALVRFPRAVVAPLRVVCVIAALLLGPLHFFRANYLPTRHETVRAVVCVDGKTGDVLWVREGLPGPADEVHRDNSPASPTACADEHGVYAYFGRSGLMAVSHSGKLLWSDRELPYKSPYGAAASPAIHEGLLVLANDRPGSPYMVAWDTRSGSRKWTTDLVHHPEYQGGVGRTPLIRSIRGKTTIVLWNWGSLDGYELASGRRLFSYPLRTLGEVVPSLVSDGKFIYAADHDHARKIDMEQLGVSQELPVVWKTRIYGPDTASPLVAGGLMYVASLRGFVTCLDANDGAILWKKRMGGRYYASPLAAGGKVYFTDYDGNTAVVALEREFKLLSENNLGALTFACPTPLDGKLLIRAARELYCIGGPATGSAVENVAQAQE